MGYEVWGETSELGHDVVLFIDRRDQVSVCVCHWIKWPLSGGDINEIAFGTMIFLSVNNVNNV